MNRRGLIKAILGTGAAAAAGVSPKELIAATPKGEAIGTGGYLSAGANAVAVGSPIDPIEAAMREKSWALQRVLADRRDRLSYVHAQMPPHIEAMKSWSPVYRQSQWQKELREIQSTINALDDPKIGAKIWEMLMGGDE